MTAHYRLCIIIKAVRSEDGVVQTVTVALRNRRAKGDRHLPADELEVGVQRLALVLPVEEREGGSSAESEQACDS